MHCPSYDQELSYPILTIIALCDGKITIIPTMSTPTTDLLPSLPVKNILAPDICMAHTPALFKSLALCLKQCPFAIHITNLHSPLSHVHRFCYSFLALFNPGRPEPHSSWWKGCSLTDAPLGSHCPSKVLFQE